MRRVNNEEELGGVINRLLRAYGLEEGYYTAAVTTYWEKFMGPAVARHTGKIKIEKGILKVQITSAALRQELSYGKENIIQALNKEIGHRLIQRVEIF